MATLPPAGAGAGAGAGVLVGAAPAAGAPKAELDFVQSLINVLRFSANQAATLIDNGYRSVDDLLYWKYDEIAKWTSAKNKLPVTRGGRTYSQLLTKRLQGLTWWVNDLSIRGQPIDITTFNAAAMENLIDEALLDHEEQDNPDKLEKPPKFENNCWNVWEQSLYNYLRGLNYSRNVPLSYVVYEPSVDFHGVARQSDKEKVENAPLAGAVFDRDTQWVHKIIQDLTLDTPVQDWIKGIDCGQRAMEALQIHFNGKAEGQHQKAQAHTDLDSLFYRNEKSFSFGKFVTKLKSCFDVLEQYKVPKHEEEKVKILLQKIQSLSY